MLNFGTQELILVLIIALVVFGPGKLPEVGKAIGKSLNEFKDAMSSDNKEDKIDRPEIKESKPVDEVKITPLGKSSTKHVEKTFTDKKKETKK